MASIFGLLSFRHGLSCPASLLVGWVVTAMVAELLCCREKEFATRDGECCPMCNKGSFVVKDCTAESGTRCAPCKPGTYMNQPNGLSTCFLCKICSQGHGLLVKQNCTVKTDTVCDVLSGYYCISEENEMGCSHAVSHSRCTTGQRVKKPGTSRMDTVCEDCQRGEFSLDGSKCTAWTVCSENEVMIKEGTLHTDAVCSRSAQRNRYGLYPPVVITVLILVLVICRIHTS